MDVFNLQAKIGLNVEEYLNGIKNAVNNSKKLVDAVNKMAEQAVTVQTQTDKAGKSMQGAAENADSLGKSVNGVTSPVDKMADAIDAIGKSTDNASQEIDGLSDSVEGVGESFDESAKDTDGLSDSIRDEAENAKKTADENKKLGEETQNAGEKAKESSFNFEKLVDSLKNVTSTAGKVVTGIAKVGAGITATITAATAGTIAATVNSVSSLAEYGDAIDKQSQKVGLSAQAYQEWDAIMQHSGASIGSMTASMRTLVNAAQSDSDALKALGISQQEALGMDQEKLFSTVITKLQNMEDQTQRTYLASKLLGRGAMEFGALLNTSAEDTEKMRQRVHELGGVLSDTAVKDAARFQDSLQDMKTGFSGLSRNLLSEFLPSFATVMDGITDIFAGDKEGGSKAIINGLSDVTKNVKETLPKILDIGEQFFSLADNLTPAIFATFEIVSDSIIEAISKIDVEKAIDNLFELFDKGSGTVGRFADSLLNLFISTLETLSSQLSVDRIGNIAKILIDGLVGGIDALIDNADTIFNLGADLIIGIGNALAESLPNLIARLPEIIQAIADGITNHIDDIILTVETIAGALVDAMMDPETVSKLVAAAISLAGAILQGLGDALIAVADIFAEIFGDEFFKEHAIDIGKAIIQGIHDGFYSIDALQGIIDFLGGTLGEAYLTAETVINDAIALLAPYEQSLEDLGADIYDFIEEFKKNWRDGWDTLEEIGSKVYDGIEKFKSGWTEFWANIATTMSEKIVEFKEKIQEIPDKFNELVDNAKTWGNDLLQNFIDGIREKISALARGVIDAANTVKKYLGFSEPEAGPLSDFHTYAPDMMELFAKGIKDNERLLTDQFDKSLSSLKAPELTAKMNAEAAYSTSGYNQYANTTGSTESILTLLQEILTAVRAGRIVAIDDAGFRTINEGLARIQRFDEGGAFV